MGYWCSLYLTETKVRWEITCILLYKEAAQKISFLQDEIDELKQSFSNNQILKNLNKMIEKYQIFNGLPDTINRILKSKNQVYLLPAILKESQNFVSDIMKISITNKSYQFCLQKVLKAIEMTALINDCMDNPAKEIDDSFSFENLKAELLLYKKLLKKFGNLNN